jgi:hypothetical protein
VGLLAEARAFLRAQDGLDPETLVGESVHAVPQIPTVAARTPVSAWSTTPRAIRAASEPAIQSARYVTLLSLVTSSLPVR